MSTSKDAEYRVIAIYPGKGKNEGCAQLEVEDTEDKSIRFTVTAPGTHSEKREVLLHQDTYLSKMLTVKFQEKHESGVPRSPVALRWRMSNE